AELGSAVLGPNCMGVAVPGGASMYIGTVTGDVRPGHVAVIAQSGSIADGLLALGPRVGFRAVVSSGGEMVTDAADFLAFFAADEQTRAVGVFLETVRRPEAFAAALALCAEAEKPVVCLKVGRSQAAGRVALAHTGALVGSRRAFSALLRAYGALEVDDFPLFVETLEVLGCRRRPRGPRAAAVSESGGEAGLLADVAEDAGLPLPEFSAELAGRLTTAFPLFLSPTNPLDAWAIDAPEKVYPGSFSLLAASGDFDMLLAQVDLSRFRGEGDQTWCETIVRALADAVVGTDLFGAVVTTHTTDPPAWATALAAERDLALLRGPGVACRALAAVAAWRPHPPGRPPVSPVPIDDLARPGALSERDSTTLFRRYGLPFAEALAAATPEEAGRAASALGGTVVVKADGPAHKAKAGGVVTGVEGAAAAAAAASRIGGPVLVARQLEPLSGTPEIVVGVTRDPQFGPVVIVGRGGVEVERLDRVEACLAPVEATMALELLRAAGLPEDDRLAAFLVALGRLASEHPGVVEAETNPVLLTADGPVAVDALVVFAP
ncbi:MAG: acetate--CoA ligase family protein, partial [Gaiella sp.]